MNTKDFTILYPAKYRREMIREISRLFPHLSETKGYRVFEEKNRIAQINGNIPYQYCISVFEIETGKSDNAYHIRFHFGLLAKYQTFDIKQERIHFSLKTHETNTREVNETIFNIYRLANPGKGVNVSCRDFINVLVDDRVA